jgi:hypothetical protein
MQLWPLRAELQHVAKHGNAAAVRTEQCLAKQRNGGRHGGRIGVIALVNQ